MAGDNGTARDPLAGVFPSDGDTWSDMRHELPNSTATSSIDSHAMNSSDHSAFVAHALVVSLLASDRKSNRPLMVSLALELVSRNLRRSPSNSSSLERSEYARRDREFLWYLLRGVVWQDFTR